jgi:hypothetical protein
VKLLSFYSGSTESDKGVPGCRMNCRDVTVWRLLCELSIADISAPLPVVDGEPNSRL